MPMSVQVAVSDPLPLFRRGIQAALTDAGFAPDAPENLVRWVREGQRKAVFLALDEPADWKLLADLVGAAPDILVVALLADPNVPTYVRAYSAGAVAVLPRDATPAAVHQALAAALDGRSLVPIDVLRAMAPPSTPMEAPPDLLRPDEVAWLRELAAGITIGKLAERPDTPNA